MNVEFDPASRYSGLRAMVFGATGFIGRHVAAGLADAGAELAVSARGSAILDALAASVDGVAIPCDVRDDAQIVAAVRQFRPAITLNLAGYGVDRSERDEDLARQVNERFPRFLCEAIAAHRAGDWAGQALIHAGTQLEYGPIGGNLAEDANAAPDTLYGRTKLAGTRAVQTCAMARALPALTARLFTVYGPGERGARLLPSILRAVATGEPLDMTDGRQQADFTWIGDVVEGLLRLGVVPATVTRRTGPQNRPGDAVNLATGRLTSVREFAERVIAETGAPGSLLRFGALPQRAETLEYEPVTNVRLGRLTGWTPRTRVAEGIRLTIRHGESANG